MNVKLIGHTPNPAWTCEVAAATCVDGRPSEKALRSALASGHESVAEHVAFTFMISGISRACLAQLTRHRLASYSVQSQRYVKLSAGHIEDMVIPESIWESNLLDTAIKAITQAMDAYQMLIDAGIPAEDARYVTPQAVPTEVTMTMNGRELRHFFSLRCCNRAQWEIRELADKMLELVVRESPVLFEDCGPGCVTGQCREAKPCGHPRKGEGLFA